MSTRVTVAVAVFVKVSVGVGDLYSAAAVWLAAAITVSNQGVEGVPLGSVICRPPATMGVRFGSSVIVDGIEVAVAVIVGEGVALG